MSSAATRYMRGCSLPTFQTESPAPLLSSAPLFPRPEGVEDDLAETLWLPPSLSSGSPATHAVPRSIVEARIEFTKLSRELGLAYRREHGIELRSDVSGIEAMQAVLLDMFPDHLVRTPEQAAEVQRHGAFLAEILARRLDAQWVDIAPGELGHWSMILPPDTRIWPFGRILRLIQMGHRERDLVSYYLELESRARTR